MLIRLNKVKLSFGLKAVLDDVGLVVNRQDKIALVGRNGEGKSTLLKVIAKSQAIDSGEVEYVSGVKVSYLSQELINSDSTIAEIITQPLETQAEHWQIKQKLEQVLEMLNLNGEDKFNELSGGLKRKTLLASALITEPDLLLLDEPTNHLDITAIKWLEQFLKQLKTALLFVSHDRQFVKNIANKVFDLDRGHLTIWQCGFEDYLIRKEDHLKAEETENAKFDKKLQQEEVWIRQGIKARRTRNEGRVRALKALRKERSERRERMGKVKMQINDKEQSGRLVLEASRIHFDYENKTIINDFSCILLRGDRVGIIGPNGCGKTTLVNLLLQNINPLSGKVKLGTNLDILYFDQLRQQIDLDMTVIDNVSGGQSHIDFGQKRIHIMSYLQQFLFSPERALAKTKTLSGGERNRLLLAKLFTKPANLLVLDEPTNDLDIETLELLEEILNEFSGTVILVSHDRQFINNVVTGVFVFGENGEINEYVGGYDDYLLHAKSVNPVSTTQKTPAPMSKTPKAKKITFEEQKELQRLPEKIAKLETKINECHEKMAQDNLYTDNPKQYHVYHQELQQQEQLLEQLFQRWQELEDKSAE